MTDYQLGWTVFGLVAALAWIAAWSFSKWKDAAVDAGVWQETARSNFEALKASVARETNAKRDLARLAQARPDQAAEAIRLSARLDSVAVMSAGVVALVEELQRTSAADRDLDPRQAAKSLSLPVSGDIAIQAIVRRVIDAVDEACLDLDLDVAASAAVDALRGGPAAPIEDVLASLGDVKRIPIRSLEDVARDARRDRQFRNLAADRSPVMKDPSLPSLAWKLHGVQPDEAVLEADGSWTLRRREAPAGATWAAPLEERGLSDDDMIARGFDLDAILAGHSLAAGDRPDAPIRIDLVPRDPA
jgi:hypothetical protein